MSQKRGFEGAMTRLFATIGAIIAFVGSVAGFIALFRQQTWLVAWILFGLALCFAGFVSFSTIYPRWARRSALVALIALPAAVFAIFVRWEMWLNAPPTNTRILVATFVDGSGNDSLQVTQDILETLRDRTAAAVGQDSQQNEIEVGRLNQVIDPAEPEQAQIAIARAKGRANRASVVVWGNYIIDGDHVKVRPHAEILRSFKLDRADGMSSKSVGQLILTRNDIHDALIQQYTYIAEAIVGIARYNASAYRDAVLMLTQAIQAIPSHPALEPDILFYYRSNSYERLGDTPNSLRDIQIAVRDNPTQVLNRTNEGVAYLNLGQIQKALESFGKALQLEPTNSAAQFDDALLEEIYLGNFNDAYATYASLAKLTPTKVWDWRFKAEAAGRLGNYDAACSALSEAVRKEPALSDIRARYADCLYHTGKLRQAIDEYTFALSLDRGDEQILYSRAMAFNAIGNQQAARTDLQNILVREPHTEIDHLNRGLALQQLGDSGQAISEYTKAIQLNKNSITALRQRSYLNSEAGAYDLAAEDLTAVVREARYNEGDLINFSGVLMKARRQPEANEYFAKVQKLPLVSYKMHDVMADVFVDRQRCDDAIAEYRKAIGMNKYDGYAYLFLAYCESKTGSNDLASRDFARAEQLLPYDSSVNRDPNGNRHEPGWLRDAAAAYVKSGELYRRLGLSAGDDRIQD